MLDPEAANPPGPADSVSSANTEHGTQSEGSVDGDSVREEELFSMSTVRELVKTLLFVVLLVFLIRAFLVQAYHIPSGSMEDTLLEGDYVLGDKLTFGTLIPDRIPIFNVNIPSFRLPGFTNPESGDLVIFEFPEDPSKDFIKRCVATSGQVVEMKARKVFVDGEIFLEPSGVKYTSQASSRRSGRTDFGPETVPEGHIFVFGDNRDNSYDSRGWGTVSLDKVKAHPLLIYFSWNRDAPVWRIWEKIRWSRLGTIE
jgi:signal peptidase I